MQTTFVVGDIVKIKENEQIAMVREVAFSSSRFAVEYFGVNTGLKVAWFTDKEVVYLGNVFNTIKKAMQKG